MGRIFSANSCRSRFDPQPKIVKPSVSHCKAVCGTPADRVASYTSEVLKCGIGEFSGRCCEERFCPMKFQKQYRKSAGRLDNFPASRRHFLSLTAPGFASLGFGKMPKARAAQRVRKKSRINFGHTSARGANWCILSKKVRGEHPARVTQRRPVGADAHPFGWGKHRVRLYAVRIRQGAAPAPPAPKGV